MAVAAAAGAGAAVDAPPPPPPPEGMAVVRGTGQYLCLVRSKSSSCNRARVHRVGKGLFSEAGEATGGRAGGIPRHKARGNGTPHLNEVLGFGDGLVYGQNAVFADCHGVVGRLPFVNDTDDGFVRSALADEELATFLVTTIGEKGLYWGCTQAHHSIGQQPSHQPKLSLSTACAHLRRLPS